MPQLTDIQSVLLSTASQRDTSSIYPLPDKFASGGKRVTSALAALIKFGFAEERETTDQVSVAREDGDIRYGLFATTAGFQAIGIEDDNAEEGAAAQASAPSAPTVERITKAAAVLMLLQREGGATLAELIEATGWLPHTTRAALTGLRKKGHAIERGKRDDQTCYSIATAA